MRAYRTAHGALIAVVPSPQEAVPAKCVATWSSDRLVQQLQTQYTLKLVHPLRNSRPVHHFGKCETCVSGVTTRNCELRVAWTEC